jgi:hypothetical protein
VFQSRLDGIHWKSKGGPGVLGNSLRFDGDKEFVFDNKNR